MEKKEMNFDHYLADIPTDFHDAARQLHELLSSLGCKAKLQQAKSGHYVSYTHPKEKKAVANLLSRKSGPMIRIYAGATAAYPTLFDSIPEDLEKKIAKASDCRRIINPTQCDSKCSMGYDLTIKGTRYQKCRYNCFMFSYSNENLPFLLRMLQSEVEHRAV